MIAMLAKIRMRHVATTGTAISTKLIVKGIVEVEGGVDETLELEKVEFIEFIELSVAVMVCEDWCLKWLKHQRWKER